ncbi:MAG: conserved membrane protein of unknown function [Nitrospira sp.]|nr:MAG: conserved membrane protein of unknown function [Nitrospira sp.]
MEPQESTITEISLIITLGMGFIWFVLPRRYAFVPLLIAGCYMSLAQALIISGVHFNIIRILISLGILRIFVRKEMFSIRLNPIDKVFLAWLFSSAFISALFNGENINLIGCLGSVYDGLGIYLIVRALIRDLDDVVLNVKMLGIMIIPLAFIFMVEHMTGKNPFSYLGGVPTFSEIRNGRIRSQGPFKHSILAGTFGATALPLFVGLMVYSTRNRVLATLAFGAAMVIILTASSSGPFLAFLAGSVGLACWYLRAYVRAIRWGIAVFFVALHIYMKDPVWFFIARISDITGGGGWYRSALINAAIIHFDEWWLSGTAYTRHWMESGITGNPNMVDIVNHYVAQGVSGGVLALFLFIWLIVKCFTASGSAVRDEARFSIQERFFIWSMGCTVLGHVVSFFSVSYFDQMVLFWYFIIGANAILSQAGPETAYESQHWESSGTIEFST